MSESFESTCLCAKRTEQENPSVPFAERRFIIMKLDELEKLKKHDKDIMETLEEIGDKILFRGYNQEQILCLLNELVKIDLLSVDYGTREQVLHVLCDAVSYYDIHRKINWSNILSIKNRLEDDLKEYVEEFIESDRTFEDDHWQAK